jgi:predicted DNA-binding transcriptional regulator YafY
MERNLQRYLGRTVEIIYVDRRGKYTKRLVQLHAIRDGAVMVFCLERQAPRLLRIDNILAMQPVMRRAV